jgi:hypothetical protein
LTIGILDKNPAVLILTGFVVLGLSYGQSSAIVPDRFGTLYRYSSVALTTNLSWILGAAFAPFLELLLASSFGLWAASLYMLSGAIVTACALYMLEKRIQSGD